MKIINPEFHAALYALWEATRDYQKFVTLLDDLRDRGNPDADWDFAVTMAKADVVIAYGQILRSLDNIDQAIEAIRSRDSF